jgi:hypothetical protein
LVRLGVIAWIGFGAFLIYFQTRESWLARQSKTWPETSGVLIVHSGPCRKSLSYRYEVNGVSYSSERVIFGELGDRNPSDQWWGFSDLPDGTAVEVYYRPENPAESTLVPALRQGGNFHLLFGGVFVLTGMLGFLVLRVRDPLQCAIH